MWHGKLAVFCQLTVLIQGIEFKWMELATPPWSSAQQMKVPHESLKVLGNYRVTVFVFSIFLRDGLW